MSSESLLQRTKRALSDGIWWEPAWWQKAQYYPPSSTDKNSTDRAFAELRQVFDPTWFLQQVDCCPDIPPRHPVATLLISEGAMPFAVLTNLGWDIITARDAGLFDADRLLTRLRHPEEYPGARFELLLLASLIREKFSVHPHPELDNGRKSDFLIEKNNEKLYLELYRPADNFPFNLAQENVLTWLNGNFTSNDIFDSPEILKRSRDYRKKATLNVFRNLKDKISGQLPPMKPGVLLLLTTSPLDVNLLQNRVSRYGQKRRDFLGVILLSLQFSDGDVRHSWRHLPNPFAAPSPSIWHSFLKHLRALS